MTIRMLASLVAVAMVSAQSIRAQTPSVCDTLAKAAYAVAPPSDGTNKWWSPVRTLDKASDGVRRIDTAGWSAERPDDLLDKLRREYRAVPDLLEAIGQQAKYYPVPTIRRAGKSALHFSESVQGTASCQTLVFFEADDAATTRLIDVPPRAFPHGPMALCSNVSGYAAEVAGAPAFIIQTDSGNSVELSVTPWRDHAWEKTCRVIIGFRNDFEVTEQSCEGPDCSKMAARALDLVKQLDQSPHVGPTNMSQLAFDAGLSDLTLGGGLFSRESTFVPIVVGGEMYLGRVGHATTVGSRELPDYLFAAYRQVGERLQPVAHIYITKRRDTPVSAYSP
jgi:hypothetical protein